MIKTTATVASLEYKQGKNGEFLVIHDETGKNYAVFEKPLIKVAEGLDGQQAVLGYEERQNGQYVNRTVKLIEASGGGANSGGDGDRQTSASVQTQQVPGPVRGTNQDWLALVQTAATKDWRAANELLKRKDINKSVALNNAIKFFEYVPEENRTPENLSKVYTRLVEILGS